MSTTSRRDNGDTPFGAWIRSQPELDSVKCGYDLEDIDHMASRQYWFNQYILGYLMLLEEKQFNRKPTAAQQDTLSVVSQAIKHGFRDPTFKVRRKFAGRITAYTYFGYHLIQFEKTSPKDGGIRIDGFPVTETELLRFLQFDKQFIEDRLQFHALTVPVEEYFLPKAKRRLRKNTSVGIPTLFNPDPLQQQTLWEA